MECSDVGSKLLNKAAKLRLPANGSFELTGDCVFSCKMCYVHNCEKQNQQTAPKSKWLPVISDCINSGLLFALITGGEPLLYEDFEDVFSEFKEGGVITTVNTNAYLLDDSKIRFFKNYPPQRFNITLYATDDDGYRDMCGISDGFTVVDRNIKKLRDNGFNIRLNLTVTKTNQKYIEELIRYGRENGISIRPTCYIFGSSQNAVAERLPPREAARTSVRMYALTHTEEELRKTAAYYAANINLAQNTLPFQNTYPGVTCFGGKASFWIHSDGKFDFCGMLPSSERPNVFDTGLEKAWTDTQKYADSIKSTPVCYGCRYRLVCKKCHAMLACEEAEDVLTSYSCMYHTALCEEYLKVNNEYEKLRHNG